MAERASRPLATILLAAGLSRRFGSNKLLHKIDGRPMVRQVAESLLAATGPGDEMIAVLGHQATELREALRGLPVRFVLNERYADGMGSSIAAGIAAIANCAEGAMIAFGDMPWITPDHLRSIRGAFDGGPSDAITLPVHAGQRGHPVIFSRKWFPALARLDGDRGARTVLAQAGDAVIEVAMPDDGVLRDLDQPDAS